MFKGKLSHQFHFIILLAAVVVIYTFNQFSQKVKLEAYSKYQDELSTIILSRLSQNVDYGLFYSEKSAVDLQLKEYKDSKEVAYIKVFDSQKNLFTIIDRRPTNLDFDNSLIKIYRTFVITEPVKIDIQDELFLSEKFKPQDTEKVVGEVVLGLFPRKPLVVEKYFSLNNTDFISNLIIITAFLILWIFIYFRQKKNSQNLLTINSSIDTQESYLRLAKSMKSPETRSLYANVIQLNNANLHYEKQLELIKREVKIAREDGNIELHEFIRYIQTHGVEDFKSELDVFYNAVLQSDKQEKTLVKIKSLFKSILTENSDKVATHEVVVYDSYTGENINSSFKTYKAMLQKMLHFLTLELSDICTGEALHINFDIRASNQNNLLRISFTSESERFLEAVNEQSMFHFDKTKTINNIHNNIRLIACKHLLQKVDGEFFYFKNELRFEIPVNIVSIHKKEVLTSSITAIDKDLSILVYDSDPIEKVVLMGYLEKYSIEAEKANTKQVILQKIRRNDYDAVFVNSSFFESPDPYFIRNFLAEISNKKSPFKVIVLSNNKTVAESPFYQQCNALYLSKPIDLTQLKAVLLDL